MGRRSKADLHDVVDKILILHQRDKLTIQQIAEKLQNEGIDIGRESVRRSLKNSKEIASDLRRTMDEARIMIDVVRDNPNTDIEEVIVTKFAGLMMREMNEIDEIQFDDPGEAALAIGRIANAKAKLGSIRMKYQNGFEAAKKSIMDTLRRELKSDHPDILERLVMLVSAIEAPQ